MYNQVASWYLQIDSRSDRVADDLAPVLIEEIECKRSLMLSSRRLLPLGPVLVMPDDLLRTEFAAVNG